VFQSSAIWVPAMENSASPMASGIRKSSAAGARANQEKGDEGRRQRHQQVGLVGHPEHRAVEQQVAHRAAAQRRGERHHGDADDVHALAPGFQNAGDGEHRDRGDAHQ